MASASACGIAAGAKVPERTHPERAPAPRDIAQPIEDRDRPVHCRVALAAVADACVRLADEREAPRQQRVVLRGAGRLRSRSGSGERPLVVAANLYAGAADERARLQAGGAVVARQHGHRVCIRDGVVHSPQRDRGLGAEVEEIEAVRGAEPGVGQRLGGARYGIVMAAEARQFGDRVGRCGRSAGRPHAAPCGSPRGTCGSGRVLFAHRHALLVSPL